jgi:hypothetical protein
LVPVLCWRGANRLLHAVLPLLFKGPRPACCGMLRDRDCPLGWLTCCLCWPPLQFPLLCLGLEGAGKSAVLAAACNEPYHDLAPTTGTCPR